MKKENLIEQLETAKALSSTVDIDKVIELIKQIEVGGLTAEIAEEIARKIELTLDRNSDYLVDLGSAEFELNHNNQIKLTRVDIDMEEITQHVIAVLDEFTIEEDEGPEFDSAGFSVADRFDDDDEDESTHHCDDLDCNCSI